jgi:SHS2 domain-containing protein
MRDFQVLEHTADVGFEAFGDTREEVFRNAGRALMNVIVDLDSVAPRETARFAVQAREPAGLLVAWLSEILYLEDTDGWLFHDFNVEGVTDNSIIASGAGERFEAGRHQIKLLVKAITYHQLALEKMSDGRWRAQVYVDI